MKEKYFAQLDQCYDTLKLEQDMHGELIAKHDVPLLTDAAGASSSFFEFQPIHLSMGVSLASSNSPIPSAPNASFTPSNRPIFNEVCVGVLDGDVTNAFAHDIVVAAVMRIDDFIFSVYMMFDINCNVNE